MGIEGPPKVYVTCPSCGGRGEQKSGDKILKCMDCNGKGKIPAEG